MLVNLQIKINAETGLLYLLDTKDIHGLVVGLITKALKERRYEVSCVVDGCEVGKKEFQRLLDSHCKKLREDSERYVYPKKAVQKEHFGEEACDLEELGELPDLGELPGFGELL